MQKRDYYAVLGVARGVSLSDLRRAYRRLARQYSPDVNFWDERAAGLFAEIEEAYRVLGDTGARVLYDRLGHRAFTPADGANGERRERGDNLHYPVEIDFVDALVGVQVVLEVRRLDPCQACRATGGAGGRQIEPCPVCQRRQASPIAGPRGATRGRCRSCDGTGWQVP